MNVVVEIVVPVVLLVLGLEDLIVIVLADLAPNFIRQNGNIAILDAYELLRTVNLPSNLLIYAVVEVDGGVPGG